MTTYSPQELRKLFPQIRHFDRQGESYLDNASTTLKLQCVLDFLQDFYSKDVSNVHRGDHHLSLEATRRYEEARETVARFLNARHAEEIIFTRGTTEGINFLALTLGEYLKEGDEICLTEMEHHSNLIPWQQIARQRNLKIRFIPVTPEGQLDLSQVDEYLNDRTKIFSVIHISNALGTINPIESLIQKARAKGILTIVDAAQSVSVTEIDVQKLGCDFLVFSGHKIFSPSGIGVLYGKKERLLPLSPYHTGGGMIIRVSLDSSEWADCPQKFEAGTPFIEGAIALAKTLSFIKESVDLNEVRNHEKTLLQEAEGELSEIPGLLILGPTDNKANILSFVIEGLHSNDLSFIMTKEKVAVRAGHHCCMPLMEKLNLSSGTVRASFSVYNRSEDVEALKRSVQKAVSLLRTA